MTEYWKLIFWLARDVVTLFPRKVAMIQLSELASVGFGYAVGGVAFAVFYVLENGTVNVLGRTLSFAP
ncbi:MAG: hypothetical protein GY761_08330, partial [Hyphomicrobiales bacterium]|nr:hypothetical protein [Hyphomicrobiales bacterium]